MIVGVAINPDSGKGRGRTYRDEMAHLLAAYPVEVVWFNSDDPAVLKGDMFGAAETGMIDALIVAGGDGMIHLAVNALGDSQIPLGIVATGSGNDIAREFSLPTHRPDEGLHQVMSALFTRKFRQIDVLEIEGGGKVERALAMANMGLDSDANFRANQFQWPKGNVRYVRGLISSLIHYRPYGVRLTVDGVRMSGSMVLLLAANTRFAGGGFNLAPHADPTDHALSVVLCRGLSTLEFPSLLGRLARARHVDDPRVHEMTAREIAVEPDTRMGIAPPPVMADGELICDLPARIRILPSRIRMAL
ncbi:MAG: diacylglycerol kinase family lipid kinase [Actinomycetaceae bacterium]|nr:diacylglycerol kinase family lipid kinase [Arcanobacterium sp.]MDD7686449.1 diacylglycerol kinase family lipid kinase [Actinomycetaceae bacterium]MDY5272729.1 diacylglycerol kinase family lipid kinase [Arcanobacterium sp.]